jgi:SAM-dependent methyltransferase
MTTGTERPVDWSGWMARWDAQQSGYIPQREERFAVMLDAVEEIIGGDLLMLDLACGPGSVSQRVLARFPQARSIAVDLDPLLLALGRGALGTAEGRLRWAEADLTNPAWVDALGESHFDAVLTTTALHWLSAAQLVQLYRELGRLVRPGGVFLNGDLLQFGPDLPAFAALAERRRERLVSDTALAARGVETWRAWWDAIAAEPALTELYAERERRFAWRNDACTDSDHPIFDLHVAALRNAGFAQVGTIWQSFGHRVLMAVR